MALIHIDRPKNLTEAAAISNAPLSECEILYEKNEKGVYEFAGLYDSDIPDEEYPDGMAAFSFRSVWVENVTLNKGTSVWNVKRSSDDKWEGQKNPNWLRVWNTKTGNSITSDSRICYVNHIWLRNCFFFFCGVFLKNQIRDLLFLRVSDLV